MKKLIKASDDFEQRTASRIGDAKFKTQLSSYLESTVEDYFESVYSNKYTEIIKIKSSFQNSDWLGLMPSPANSDVYFLHVYYKSEYYEMNVPLAFVEINYDEDQILDIKFVSVGMSDNVMSEYEYEDINIDRTVENVKHLIQTHRSELLKILKDAKKVMDRQMKVHQEHV